MKKEMMVGLAILTMGVTLAVQAKEKPEKAARKPAGGAEHFARMDADGNGTVNLEEFTAYRSKMVQKRAKGEVDEARLLERLTANFKRMDADQSGELTKEELKQARARMQQRRKPGAEAGSEQPVGKRQRKGAGKGAAQAEE
ncbi:MAG: EF-hand domain-containing protein [Candidatus Marinimicrobia bacterium]|nr:EF-hand domain-containing protein [Candidatus Neomarinimicrobiota bacterium]